MDYHQNARLTIYSRAEPAKTVLEQGVTNTSGPATSSTSILNGWLGSSSPAIDDHSRISFAAILPGQNHQLAMLFFFMTRAFYSRFGFAIKRVLTDNGPCYRDGNFQTLLFQQRIKHRFTRPYTPRTNGKAERFIKTALCEWAYARTYQTSLERQDQLGPWLHDYNFHRQHASLNHNT